MDQTLNTYDTCHMRPRGSELSKHIGHKKTSQQRPPVPDGEQKRIGTVRQRKKMAYEYLKGYINDNKGAADRKLHQRNRKYRERGIIIETKRTKEKTKMEQWSLKRKQHENQDCESTKAASGGF